jgi:uncharacterized lipoprotein YddW (UPF0748 family)
LPANDRRHFLKTVTAAAVAAAVPSSVVAAEPEPLPTPRRRPRRDRPTRNGIWVPAAVEHTSEEWARLFDRMRVAGVDGVLLQVFDGRHVYWDSGSLPVQSERLKALVPFAKDAGLEVHAWIDTLSCAVPAVIDAHPEWLTRNHAGAASPEPLLDPAIPEVRAFVKAMVREVAAVPDVAGVHLDALRYPAADYGYTDYGRAEFRKAYGVDPRAIADDALQQKWTQYRLDALVALVNEDLATAAHAAERVLTATVLADIESARATALQDWRRFKLNAFFPLFDERQSADPESIRACAQEAAASVTVPVCAGLSVANLAFPHVAKAVRAALDAGASGVALRSLDAMTEDRWMGMQVVVIGQRPD